MLTNSKTCPKCSKVSTFFKNKAKADGFSTYCKACHTAEIRERSQKNPEPVNKQSRKWRAKNPDKYKLSQEKWVENNRAFKNSFNAKRRAAKLNATPQWLSEEHLERITCFYTAAQFLSKILNVKVVVDHIVPLLGVEVRGLHVPWNLQLLPARANESKGNRL